MSAIAIARNDLRETRQSTVLWLIGATVVLGFGALTYAAGAFLSSGFDLYLDVLTGIFVLLAPLIGVALGYKSVIAERESGTIALLMSLPHSRVEVVIGKLLGRFVVAGTLVALALVGSGVVSIAVYPTFDLPRFAVFALLTIVYTFTFVALATGFSMAMSSSRRVIGAAFGAYVLLILLWNQVVNVLVLLLFRFRPVGLRELPLWAESAKFCTPFTSFTYLLETTLGVGSGATGVEVGSQWFASTPVALAILCAWIVFPPAIGYLRFRTAEF